MLTLNAHVWIAGCGTGMPFPTLDGWVRVEVVSGHALKSVVRGSNLESISALEVNPGTRQFRFVLPGQDQTVTGGYEIVGGVPVVSSVEFAKGGLSATFEFDSQKRITQAFTSTGQRWQPENLDSPLLFGPGASGVDAYIAANATLVGQLRSLDSLGGGNEPGAGSPGVGGGGGVPPFQSGKAILAAQDVPSEISGVLGILGFILAIQATAAAWPALYFVFQVVVAVNLTMSFLGVSAPTGEPNTGDPSTVTGDATIRVVNNLSDGTPIWYVVMLQDPITGAPGANLLGEEGIPAGSSRDFAVPGGARSFNLITPSGTQCYLIYDKGQVTLSSGGVVEIVLVDSDSGDTYPEECASE